MTDIAAPVKPRDCPYRRSRLLHRRTRRLVLRTRGRERQDHHQPAGRAPDPAARGERRGQELAAPGRRRVAASPATRGRHSLAPSSTSRWCSATWKDDPVRDLIGEIAAAVGPFLAWAWCGRPAAPSGSTRRSRQRRTAADAGLLVILDQFEEYFVYCSQKRTPERFADELARCINRAEPARQLPDLDPRGRLRGPRRPVQGPDRQRLRQLPAHRLPRPGVGGAGDTAAAGGLQPATGHR